MAFGTPIAQEEQPVWAEDYPIQALAIRDTSAHASAVVDCRGFKTKTIWLNYACNQAATLTISVSHDGANWKTLATQALSSAQGWVAIGAAAGLGTSITAQAGLAEAWAYLQLSVTASVAPTTGTLDAWVSKQAA